MPKFVLPLLGLVIWCAAAGAAAALPPPAIDLDAQAQNLPLGDLPTWTNPGSIRVGAGLGEFFSHGQLPIVAIVAGRKAVTFTGMNGMMANFYMPAAFSGNNPWTVSYSVYNPSVQRAERIFGWTMTWVSADRGAFFGYGSDPAHGAAAHGGGGGLGFDRGVPASNAWHNITITYSGASGWEKVWVDGALNAIEQRPGLQPLNLYREPVWLGVTDHPSASYNFSGSLGALKVYAAEASWAEIQMLVGITMPGLVNRDFELSDPGAGRIFAGWAPTTLWNPITPDWTGIGAWGRNLNLNPGDGPWDNGVAVTYSVPMPGNGNRVLAIAGAASGTRAVSQWLNLNGGEKYGVTFIANAASGGRAQMKLELGGTTLVAALDIDPVDDAGRFEKPFTVWSGEFTPTADGVYELRITQLLEGTQNVLLVDRIEVSSGGPAKPALEAKPERAAAATTPALANGGFEALFVKGDDPWHNLAYGKARGDNRGIPRWSVPQDGIGVADATHPVFKDGAAPPEGRQALWMQTRQGFYETTRTVSQTVDGWDGAKTYVIGLWASGSNLGAKGGAAGLQVRLGGRALAARPGQGGAPLRTGEVTTITASGGTMWHHLLYDFQPPGGVGGQYHLELAAIALSGEKILLIDNVRIYKSGSPPAASCPQLALGPLRFRGVCRYYQFRESESEPTTATFINEGGTTLTLSNFRIVGNQTHFRTENTTYTVAPFGGSCAHPVVMLAQAYGAIGGAWLQCNSDDTTGTWQVPLLGYAVSYPVFPNGSFEQPWAYWAGVGYWRSQGQGIPGGIPYWQLVVPPGSGDPSEYFGIATQMSMPDVENQWNNGAHQYGIQAAWLRVGKADDPNPALRAPKALRQRVYGFYDSASFTFWGLVNARAVGDNKVEWGVRYGPDEDHLLDLISLHEMTAVTTPYIFNVPLHYLNEQFTTSSGLNMRSDGSILFEIYVTNQVDDSTLLIDIVACDGWYPRGAAQNAWAKYE